MRELCVDARLETREPDEPGDPNRHDNRICRAVDVERPAGRRERSAPAPEEAR
jgi:hypothetical protein